MEDQAPDTRSDVYAELASVGPYGVNVGHALITMVEPHPGHGYAYNRWYEDDHFVAGAMAMPWLYAGRRWVATRDLQLLRYPEKPAIAQPVSAGCYVKQVEGVGTRLTLLWFLQRDPREVWEGHFTGLDEEVAASGLGRVELVAPFVPTVPGTDTYVDRLR